MIYTKVDPKAIQLEDGFTRDVTEIGYYGTGDLEIRVKKNIDLERAKLLLVQAL